MERKLCDNLSPSETQQKSKVSSYRVTDDINRIVAELRPVLGETKNANVIRKLITAGFSVFKERGLNDFVKIAYENDPRSV